MATVPAKIVTKVGVVIAAHRCAKTVKVRVAKTVHDPRIRNYIQRHECFLAHDERSACVEGDIVMLHPGRTSSTKLHLVTGIVSAVATASERLAPETYEEWTARCEHEYKERQLRKLSGPNREHYVKKYAQVLPLEVARVKEEIKREKREKLEKELELAAKLEEKEMMKKKKEPIISSSSSST